MIEFVDLMEGRSVGIVEDDQAMDKFWFSGQWIMEPVYQGIRYQCLIDENNEIKFLGKKKNYKQQNSMYLLSGLIEEIKSLSLPKNTLFEGYLTFNNDLKKAYKFIKSTELEQDLSSYVFFVTDLIYLEGQDFFTLPLFDRRSRLQVLFSKQGKFIKLQQGYTSKKKDVYSKLSSEYKIFLFKNLDSCYSFKQSMNWRILKTPQPFYMVVMGIVENKTNRELANMVLALEGGQVKEGKLQKIMNIPVHSHDSRIFLYNSKDEIVGKVFEFLAFGNAKDGKYMETRFSCLREDKKLEDCIYVEES